MCDIQCGKWNLSTDCTQNMYWCQVCLIQILNSTQSRMPSRVVVVISHPQERRDFSRGWIRAVDTSDPELWKNKALFSCWDRSLQDSIRASHKQVQLLDLRWEWMERTRARAKPQRQTPNLTNKHQPRECQLGTQMYVVFFLFLHPQHIGLQYTDSWSAVETYYMLWCSTSAKGTQNKKNLTKI